MLSDNVNYYTSWIKTLEEFQEWYKEYHRDCWDYYTGDCGVCAVRKAKILLAYVNAMKTSDEGERNGG